MFVQHRRLMNESKKRYFQPKGGKMYPIKNTTPWGRGENGIEKKYQTRSGRDDCGGETYHFHSVSDGGADEGEI